MLLIYLVTISKVIYFGNVHLVYKYTNLKKNFKENLVYFLKLYIPRSNNQLTNNFSRIVQQLKVVLLS